VTVTREIRQIVTLLMVRLMLHWIRWMCADSSESFIFRTLLSTDREQKLEVQHR
jgi:hypothetical protein